MTQYLGIPGRAGAWHDQDHDHSLQPLQDLAFLETGSDTEADRRVYLFC